MRRDPLPDRNGVKLWKKSRFRLVLSSTFPHHGDGEALEEAVQVTQRSRGSPLAGIAHSHIVWCFEQPNLGKDALGHGRDAGTG